MHKTSSDHFATTAAFRVARTFLKKNGGRLAAFLVLAFFFASFLVPAGSLAKTKKTRKRVAQESSSRLRRLNTKGLAQRKGLGENRSSSEDSSQTSDGVLRERKPIELRLVKAHEFNGDLRQLPATKPVRKELPEREPPDVVLGTLGSGDARVQPGPSTPGLPAAPMPTPDDNFLGLDFANWGAGRPPDTVGDVGPAYYIQNVNTSIGIYRKSDNVRVAAFTFDTFMSQGNFGNLCDTENFGDPVVLYDSFEDRWIMTDFAFTIDGSGNVNSSAAYQCFAASKTNDPVTGGWNYYSINSTTLLGDYPKFGIWPDGLYMSANMFGFPASAGFSKAQLWAFNKHQMYAGNPNVQIVTFDAPAGEFALLPSNARLQTGTPPTGTPNLFSVVWQFANVFTVYKFHVDWTNTANSTLTGPFNSVAPASFQTPPATVPAQGGNNNDTLGHRLQMQNQYTNLAGVESLWNVHTVRGAVAARSSIRYYQVGVTGGTIGAAPLQSFTYTPDTQNRYMPSLAVDRAGNMAIGFSASSATLFPAIRYVGRLAGDPVSTLPQTETSLVEGTGSQNTSTRWGDYSTMTLDPDGCTFWYTTEYYITTGNNWQTRIGSFAFPNCTPVGAGGTIQGTVTDSATTNPIVGATVTLGARTTTTDGVGHYIFTPLPAGTYPSETASFPGYVAQTVNSLVVNDAASTTQNFALTASPVSACLVDTTQADFNAGQLTDVDTTTTPGSVTITNAPSLDQSNTNITSSGFTFNATNWGGQTFIAGVNGPLVSADLALFCSGCTGTTPNITLSLRNTAAGLPTGADLATATIPGFSAGTTSYRTGTFSVPPTLTAGTQYALVIRPVSNPSPGSYVYLVSAAASAYANGSEVFSGTSGATWAADIDDLGFHTFMNTGYRATGTYISSLKDSNPGVGMFSSWGTISWNATVPANTTVRFQAAGSNNPAGPFNFVGPDHTAATFFNSGDSLLQFNTKRYLKYKAILSTTNSAVTPTLNDVTVCYNNTNTPTAAPANISGRITDAAGSAVAGVVVNLSGARTAQAITDSNGNYRFTEIETSNFYTVTPSLVNYRFSPENLSFSLLANKSDAVFTATRDAVIVGNAIDTPEYFVRQHYVDFLGREPDPSGFAFWSDQIRSCGNDADCIERRTINVSAAYFLSGEFQETGGMVDKLYRASYGRRPLFAEFMPDAATVGQGVIVGGEGDWTGLLNANKTAFIQAWVQRPEFQAVYGGLNNASYVNTLIGHTGVSFTQAERAALVSGLENGTLTRATALRRITEDGRFVAAKRNEAFVMMQYFGYLRRDPDEAGYRFWLNKLNQFGGNFEQAEMVKSFIVSGEYRNRFR